MTTQQNFAFLGLGQMGAPIARLLLKHGHNVTLWNRSPQKSHAVKAESIAPGKAHIAASPQEAVAHADIIFTMFTDDAATLDADAFTAFFKSEADRWVPLAKSVAAQMKSGNGQR